MPPPQRPLKLIINLLSFLFLFNLEIYLYDHFNFIIYFFSEGINKFLTTIKILNITYTNCSDKKHIQVSKRKKIQG